MTYAVKEMFLTLQGEGFHTGRRAVFIRFAGCNLWTGREDDRAKAQCKFCDTDFVGGDKFTDAVGLADCVEQLWGNGWDERFVVLTGGEPTLQVDDALLWALKRAGFYIAMESNGTRHAPEVDWLCVSPKAGTDIVQRRGSELKVVWPQPFDLSELEGWDFRHFYLQPMDGNPGAAALCIEEIHKRPKWKLSLQTHKLVGIP